jgi:hypothetical protein
MIRRVIPLPAACTPAHPCQGAVNLSYKQKDGRSHTTPDTGADKFDLRLQPGNAGTRYGVVLVVLMTTGGFDAVPPA